MKLDRQVFRSGIVMITAALMLSACDAGQTDGRGRGSITEVSEPESSTPDKISGSTGATLIRDDGNVADGMRVWAEDAKEFCIMCVDNRYLEVPGDCKPVYLGENGRFPELDDGQIASVTADVQIYDGGEAGFMHNIFIEDLISYSVIDRDKVADIPDIPDAGSTGFSYGVHMLKYDTGDHKFLLVMNERYVHVYLDGYPITEYEQSVHYEDMLDPFFEWISGMESIPGMVRPELTEEEILNMTDEDFWYYGDLAAEGFLIDVSCRNPVRSNKGITVSDGYRYVGRWADVSASDPNEAEDIARKWWDAKENDDNTYGNVMEIDENDEYWLFRSQHSYRGQHDFYDTVMVYNKEYFDAETSTAKFTLDDDSIRHFFACRTPDNEQVSKTCIGEFVIPDGDGYVFRRYYIWISFGDWGLNDTAHMSVEEWHISGDGRVEYVDSDRAFSFRDVIGDGSR